MSKPEMWRATQAQARGAESSQMQKWWNLSEGKNHRSPYADACGLKGLDTLCRDVIRLAAAPS